MATGQAFGIAALIARTVLERNSASTAMMNGISAINPLTRRRGSCAMGKFAPSATISATASHDARKAAIRKGPTDLAFAGNEVRRRHLGDHGVHCNHEDGKGKCND